MTSPKITDACNHDFASFAMLSEVVSTVPGKVIAAVNLCRKCYQRDRRVGPKCRRKEWDDFSSPFTRRCGDDRGRRTTDKTVYYNLPRKSDRLAREAEEKAKEEIAVSTSMTISGQNAFKHPDFGPHHAVDVYRKMERVRREELKAQEGAPCGASVPEIKSFLVCQGEPYAVAVGFPINRTDGLASLHVGSTVVLLDRAEREALVRALEFPYAPERAP